MKFRAEVAKVREGSYPWTWSVETLDGLQGYEGWAESRIEAKRRIWKYANALKEEEHYYEDKWEFEL
jgi:hypothetical protein